MSPMGNFENRGELLLDTPHEGIDICGSSMPRIREESVSDLVEDGAKTEETNWSKERKVFTFEGVEKTQREEDRRWIDVKITTDIEAQINLGCS